jgi:cytochrome c oxidase subunit II
MREPSHLRRILIAWIVASVILTPIIVLVAAPGLPPGDSSSQASGQVTDNTVLLGILTPIATLIVVYFAYSLRAFRHRDGEPDEGVAIRGDRRVQLGWIVATSAVVLVAAVYGTVRLFSGGGAGGGQGSNPVAKLIHPLQVQVIGQEWAFTYRFPSYGGVETPHLELPVNRDVEFHVTSLDVIHSFWVHDLGVKVDANPGLDNIAYVKPTETGSYDLRCAELCGLFHGHMFDTMQVVSDARFATWIKAQQRLFAPATRNLPPYNIHYYPKPERRAG